MEHGRDEIRSPGHWVNNFDRVKSGYGSVVHFYRLESLCRKLDTHSLELSAETLLLST